MSQRSKIYFASDFHLGVPDYASSREREDRIIRWLDSIKHDAAEIYLVGDVFDFWFEYASVIPKGFIRFQGKLAELTDSGIKITLFKGNHDMWMFKYFTKELGISIVSNELIIERSGKKFFIHHGDGLGAGDFMYKLLKKFFRSGFCQCLFARVHPNFGVGVANYWSKRSRKLGGAKKEFIDDEQEWLVGFCREELKNNHFDYMVFGHRHLPLDISLNTNSRYINLGEWIYYNSYAVFDGVKMELKYFEGSSKS